MFEDIHKLKLKQTLILDRLLDFYEKPTNKKILLAIIRQETSLSLRLLDWLSTNYSKKYSIMYNIGPCNKDGTINSSKNFNLWLDYKNQLKAYSKKLFDPFCRRERIFFNVKTNQILKMDPSNNIDDGIITTPGQLNFFRWAITNKVIDYAFDHFKDIEADMMKFSDFKGPKQKSRRSLLRNSHNAKLHELSVVVKFS